MPLSHNLCQRMFVPLDRVINPNLYCHHCLWHCLSISISVTASSIASVSSITCLCCCLYDRWINCYRGNFCYHSLQLCHHWHCHCHRAVAIMIVVVLLQLPLSLPLLLLLLLLLLLSLLSMSWWASLSNLMCIWTSTSVSLTLSIAKLRSTNWLDRTCQLQRDTKHCITVETF